MSLSFEVYYLLLKNIKCEQSAAKTATTGPIYAFEGPWFKTHLLKLSLTDAITVHAS